jgi:hypothetical protein
VQTLAEAEKSPICGNPLVSIVSNPVEGQFGTAGRMSSRRGTQKVIAGPLADEESILTAESDLRTSLQSKQWSDAIGQPEPREPVNPRRQDCIIR